MLILKLLFLIIFVDLELLRENQRRTHDIWPFYSEVGIVKKKERKHAFDQEYSKIQEKKHTFDQEKKKERS